MTDEIKSFRVTSGDTAPNPKKWFVFLVINAAVGGLLFMYEISVAWSIPGWLRVIKGEVILEVLNFLLATSALVFAMAFVVDLSRIIFKRKG